jgi:hypothetical protein
MTNAGLCESTFINGIRTSVFPNPVSDVLTVVAETERPSENISLSLLDSGGRLLKDISGISDITLKNGLPIDVSTYPAGCYYLLINAAGSKLAQPIVITR